MTVETNIDDKLNDDVAMEETLRASVVQILAERFKRHLGHELKLAGYATTNLSENQVAVADICTTCREVLSVTVVSRSVWAYMVAEIEQPKGGIG